MPQLSFQSHYPITGASNESGNVNKNLAEEYRTLFCLTTPSIDQANRMEEILTLARHEKQLDIMITGIVLEEAENQHLADDDCMTSYKNQIAVLREYQGTPFSGFENPIFGKTQEMKISSDNSMQPGTDKEMQSLATVLTGKKITMAKSSLSR